MKTMLSLLGALSIGLNAIAADPPAYTLHEWGTFTSVSGSDGVLLPGLQREEEPLPLFVLSHDGMANQFTPGGAFMKGWRRPLSNVTIKMETPVIYFYANQQFNAHVQVGFNGGSISQWYPPRSGGETPPPYTIVSNWPHGGDIDFAKTYHGNIEWNVQIQPRSADDNASIFKPGQTLTWVYPRQTDSALVRAAGGAAEKFLFYRGVGNFSLPVKFTLPGDQSLRIENASRSAIPALLIFNRPRYDDQVDFALLDPLKAGETRSTRLSTPDFSPDWRHEVYAAMRKTLVNAGLYPKEADAMLQTWWNSYFERPGLRVFWIVPEDFTRSVLPLSVDPAPRQQVRVLVGRSELLTPSFEQDIIQQFTKEDQSQNYLRSDRFGLAYEARVNALARHGQQAAMR